MTNRELMTKIVNIYSGHIEHIKTMDEIELDVDWDDVRDTPVHNYLNDASISDGLCNFIHQIYDIKKVDWLPCNSYICPTPHEGDTKDQVIAYLKFRVDYVKLLLDTNTSESLDSEIVHPPEPTWDDSDLPF